MKKIFVAVILISGMPSPALAEEMNMMHHHMEHGMIQGMDQAGMAESGDPRTSLNLPAPMRLRQLAMMREHLAAVQSIVGLLAENKFDEASAIAHHKLGLTPEMKKKCNMVGTSDFRALRLTFHKRADELSDVLKTGNMKRSLSALHTTINSCVQCHATFRQ